MLLCFIIDHYVISLPMHAGLSFLGCHADSQLEMNSSNVGLISLEEQDSSILEECGICGRWSHELPQAILFPSFSISSKHVLFFLFFYVIESISLQLSFFKAIYLHIGSILLSIFFVIFYSFPICTYHLFHLLRGFLLYL